MTMRLRLCLLTGSIIEVQVRVDLVPSLSLGSPNHAHDSSRPEILQARTGTEHSLIFITITNSQLTTNRLLLPNNLHLRPPIAQTNLPTLHARHKPHILPPTILLPSPPNLRNQTIPRLNRRREPRSKLPQIRRIAAAQQLQQAMRRRVPRVQAVHDRASKAHGLARLGSGVQRVVIAVQTIQVRRLGGRLVLVDSVGCFPLWRREVLGFGALGAVPVSLADEEGRARDVGVDFAARFVHQVHLRLHHRAGLALVVDAQDALAELEGAAFGGCGDGLEEGHGAFSIDDALGVEFGDARDAAVAGGLGGVEVDYFLRCFLEGQDDGVCRESGKRWMKLLCRKEMLSVRVILSVFTSNGMVAYIEEVKLINSGSNAPCEQQDITLQPCHGLGRILV